MTGRVCTTCRKRKAKLWICRSCGGRFCEHFCANKTSDGRATCGACKRASGPLGLTTRRGPRTGTIEVHPSPVGLTKSLIRVTEALSLMRESCGVPGQQGFKVGVNHGVHVGDLEVVDIETGKRRKIPVKIDARGTFFNRSYSFHDGKTTESIGLHPPTECMTRSDFNKQVRSDLMHELTHAADSGRKRVYERNIKRVLETGQKPQRQKVGSCEYYNDPTEVAAYSQQIRLEILDKPCGRDIESKLYVSGLYTQLRACLTPKNLRKVQKVAAIAWAEKCARTRG